jgi:predicted nucleic acid-binding protein
VRYVLDTSAVIAHYRQEVGWEAVQGFFEADDTEILIASVTLTEFGRRLHALGADQGEVEEALASYQLLFTEVVAINTAVAVAAFAISCQTPHRLPLVDALIAAVANSKDAILVHCDEHMRVIPAELVRQHDLDSTSS